MSRNFARRLYRRLIGATLIVFAGSVSFAGDTSPSPRNTAVPPAPSEPVPKVRSPEDVKTGQPARVVWLSDNETVEQLDQMVTTLYLTLLNSKRLSVKIVEARQRTIDQVLRDEKIIFGSQIPIQLDSIVCELNRHVCSRLREPVNQGTNSLTAAVLGTRASRGVWRNPIKGDLVLPHVPFKTGKRWIVYSKRSGERLKDVVLRKLKGCEHFDDACRKAVQNYNPSSEVFDPRFEGRVTLPVLSVIANVDVTAVAEISGRWASIYKTLPRPSDALLLKGTPPDSPGATRELYKIGSLRRETGPDHDQSISSVLRSLEKNLVHKSVATSQSVITKSDIDGYNVKLGDGIRLPYKLNSQFPKQLRKQVTIAVLDRWFDQDHCGLIKGKHVVFNHPGLKPPALIGSRAKCDEDRKSTNDDSDHAIHVLGIISTINPHADIIAKQLDFRIEDPNVRTDQAAELDDLIGDKGPDVVNISWGLENRRGADPLKKAIEGASNTFFVVAAGNEGEVLDDKCPTTPACYVLNNLIVVAAFDSNLNPNFLKNGDKLSTNVGPRVHVAAPGDRVLSFVANGRYAEMSGTSQAAPQVTAIASLLKGQVPRMSALEVKNRLIYCSKLVPDMEKQMFGGLVDAECVLDGEWARVKTSAEGLRHLRFAASDRVSFKSLDTDRQITFEMGDIRSIQLNAADESYTVFSPTRRTPSVRSRVPPA